MNCMKTHGMASCSEALLLDKDLPAAVLQPALAVVMVF